MSCNCLLLISLCVCVGKPKNVVRLRTGCNIITEGAFSTYNPVLRFCDYVALHHKELLSNPKKAGSGEWVGIKIHVRWMASHFIEFFASLILLLRCTSLLLNWIDSRSLAPFFPSVIISPPHVCRQAKVWQYFRWACCEAKEKSGLCFVRLHESGPEGLIFH